MADVTAVSPITHYSILLSAAEAEGLARLLHYGVESATVDNLGLNDFEYKLVEVTKTRGEDPSLTMFSRYSRLA